MHCWATIDPSGTECVYEARRIVRWAYTEKVDKVHIKGRVMPHIRIKDRVAYIAAGNKHQARAVRVETDRTELVQIITGCQCHD